jgi:CO dehydrogenase maturation factor
VVIDNEAGMEHLSRRTTQNVDALLVVSDLSQVGLQAAGRIRDLARKLQLKVGHSYLVLNRVQEKGREGEGRGGKGTEGENGKWKMENGNPESGVRSNFQSPIANLQFRPAVAANIAATGLDLLGAVPRDDLLEEFSLTGRPVWELPDDAPSLRVTGELLEKISPRAWG